MGADIHSFAEVRREGKWHRSDAAKFSEGSNSPFSWRNYGIFGFLADVRNYSRVPVIAEPRGLPEDSEWLNSTSPYAYDYNPMSGNSIPVSEQETNLTDLRDMGCHSYSFLTLAELLAYDYDQTFEDRRTTKTEGNVTDCAALADKGEGVLTTMRDFLGGWFFKELETLKTLGEPEDVRIVFYFDS